MPPRHSSQRKPGTKTSVYVERTPRECMLLLLDIRAWPRWRTGVADVDHVSDESILMASAWIETWRLGLKTVRLGARVVEVHAPRDFVYVASGDGLATRTAWSLRPSGRGTRITQTLHAEATGLLGWWTDLPKAWLDHSLHSLESLPRFLDSKTTLQLRSSATEEVQDAA